MPKPLAASDLMTKLRRLWKGTLYTLIGVIYASYAVALLLYRGWGPLLLALVLIGIGQLFRYLANDVDRIGWAARIRSIVGEAEAAGRLQRRMSVLLFGLIQLAHIGLVCQAYVVGRWVWSLPLVGGLLLVEVLYAHIRSANRMVQFEQASYGFRDRSAVLDGVDLLDPGQYREQSVGPTLDERLATLKAMADRGEISQEAYVRVRDAKLIERVLGGPSLPWEAGMS